ncbi:MAG: 16S rRNA processing protein RimM [Ignavibacteria bacterium]|nr:16S rRNA processing protein RimM [Ignavibacteria bacterium]
MEPCLIGTIVGVHGIAGGMKIRSYSDVPGRFARLERVYAGRDGGSVREYTVRKAAGDADKVLLFFDGIDDRTAAETLVGLSLFIEEKDMLPPPTGRYFVHDLIGCTVLTEQGLRRGEITDVLLMPANDLYVVRCDGREVLVPAVPDIVRNVDLASRTVTVADLPGLFQEEVQEEDEN